MVQRQDPGQELWEAFNADEPDQPPRKDTPTETG